MRPPIENTRKLLQERREEYLKHYYTGMVDDFIDICDYALELEDCLNSCLCLVAEGPEFMTKLELTKAVGNEILKAKGREVK